MESYSVKRPKMGFYFHIKSVTSRGSRMTSKKDLYQYRIFKTYSILVDFDGEPRLENVPSPISGETFNRWCRRVLGDDVTNVAVYSPWKPAPQTKMSTIKRWSPKVPLKGTFKALAREKNLVRKDAVEQTTESVTRAFVGFSQDTLSDLLDELKDELQPAVGEFFKRFQDSSDSEIDTADMLRLLIDRFNSNVIELRKANAKNRLVASPA